jgi:tRNA pseudouridine13 synthase
MPEPFLTADLPGTGGRIRESAEDFCVEEIPLYVASGSGEHTFVLIEKQNLTTHDLLRRAADTYGVPEREIGYAGLKDARATTRQTISVPHLDPDTADRLNSEGIRVLAANRHQNKLRPGHLVGNRFRIRIRGCEAGSAARAEAICSVLHKRGVPNFFGSQRYGALGNSHRIGTAIIRGDFDTAMTELIGDPDRIDNERWREAAIRFRAGDANGALAVLPQHCRFERQALQALTSGRSARKSLLGLSRNILRLYLSACQSHLFDRLLTMRLATLDTIWPGDFAYRHDNGSCFFVEDAAAENERAKNFTISATGPLYGFKSTLARGQSGILEESLLASEKLQLVDFKLGSGLDMPGERRPLRIPLADPTVAMNDGLVLSFALPAGSYATSVLREVMKSPVAEKRSGRAD